MPVRIGVLLPDFNRSGAPHGAAADEGRPGTRGEARQMLFDRLRVASYPHRPRYQERIFWEERVRQMAREINSGLGSFALRDSDALRIADGHAAWCWGRLAHFVNYRHDSEIQSWRGTLSGKVRRGKVRARDRQLVRLLTQHPGTPFTAVSRLCRISATQVMRIVRRDAPNLYREIRCRFTTLASRVGHSASRTERRRWQSVFRCLTSGKLPKPPNSHGSAPQRRGRTDGAQERTRTSTPIQALAPEASASTNSATWANRVECRLGVMPVCVNRLDRSRGCNVRGDRLRRIRDPALAAMRLARPADDLSVSCSGGN